MELNKRVALIFTIVLVCKIFSFDEGNIPATEKSISDWLQGKKVVSWKQSSCRVDRRQSGNALTTITIIAEANNGTE